MAQNRRLAGDDLRDIAEVCLGHGQPVAVKIVADAGGQVRFAEVDLIIAAGLGPLHIVHAANEVIVGGRVVVGIQVPLQPAEDVQLAGVALLQLGHLRAVQRRAAFGHTIFNIAGGVAVAGKAQRFEPGLPGGHRQFVQGVFAVAQLGVDVHRTQFVFARHGHCILSCFTLWSTTWRFSSSRVISSTEMPSSIISTSTW